MILISVYYILGKLLSIWIVLLSGIGNLVPDPINNSLSYFISPVFQTFKMLAPVLYVTFIFCLVSLFVFFGSLYGLRALLYMWRLIRGINTDTIIADKVK